MPAPLAPSLQYPLYLGIDPGVCGGLALISEDEVMVFKTMPSTLPEIWDVLVDWPRRCGRQPLAMIERIVPGFAGTHKSAMSKLYGSYMALQMGLVAAGIPYQSVSAQIWHKTLGIKPRGRTEKHSTWKNRLKNVATELFPQLRITLATADALLIAHYCKLTYGDSHDAR